MTGTFNCDASLDVELPAGFELGKVDQYISELKAFLTSPLVQSLILAHPNEVAIQGGFSPLRDNLDGDWWSWAANLDTDRREEVTSRLINSAIQEPIAEGNPLHPSLKSLIQNISRLRLPRDPTTPTPAPNVGSQTPGMSPKKAHEVDRLSELIDKTYTVMDSDNSTRLIVDVGAGQGYLSHRLAEKPGTRVLALDGDEGQTEGAALRSKGLSHAERQRARVRSDNNQAIDEEGCQESSTLISVTHRTLFITSDSLLGAIDEWVSSLELDRGSAMDPIPVLVTGLHACGSLTPAVLRCFVDLCVGSGRKDGGGQGNGERGWRPGALVLVGCCYNLMRNLGDFPLSQTTISACPNVHLELSQNHLQLAAQCPAQWTRSEVELERANLARRKVVWRALLARLLHTTTAAKSPPTRLGRLPDRAYTSWDTFLTTASTKMGVPIPASSTPIPILTPSTPISTPGDENETLAFQLSVLHILRALVGPVVESLIVVDRAVYLAEQLSMRGDGG
ncbi:hypothetical protein BDV93DRAFT_604148 [Ceratobasidium sp. AG-I]|nr:hypothetical protein BDV93DRAFT_604148 [Ceratobasidium sp. AG-I]